MCTCDHPSGAWSANCNVISWAIGREGDIAPGLLLPPPCFVFWHAAKKAMGCSLFGFAVIFPSLLYHKRTKGRECSLIWALRIIMNRKCCYITIQVFQSCAKTGKVWLSYTQNEMVMLDCMDLVCDKVLPASKSYCQMVRGWKFLVMFVKAITSLRALICSQTWRPEEQRYVHTNEYGFLLVTELLGHVSSCCNALRYLSLANVQLRDILWICLKKSR